MEVIDYLLVFWFLVAIGVCSLGSLYVQQREANEKRNRKKRATDNRRASYLDSRSRWDSPETASSDFARSAYDTNSKQFNAQQSYAGAYGAATINTDSYSSQSFQQQQQQSDWRASNHRPLSSRQRGDRQPYNVDAIESLVRNSRDYSMSPPQVHGRQLDDSLRDSMIPVATGMNSDCVEWVNSILYLFYSQTPKYMPQIVESVYRSLNEKLANLTSESEFSDLIVEFTGINCEQSSRPELTNIRTESESDKSVSAICKVYMRRIVFDLTIRQTGGHLGQDAHQFFDVRYELILENLEGKLKTVAMLLDKLIVVQFMEKPDTKILMRPKYSASGPSAPINEDVLVNMILLTLQQVVIDLYFGDDPEFPQFKSSHHSAGNIIQTAYRNKLNALKGSASEIKRQIKHDFFGALTSSADKERKVFLKILQAKNINYNQNVTCLMELDAPYQQAATLTKQGSNPLWDEHFLFLVNDKSHELRLELWDSIDTIALASAHQQQEDSSHQTHKRSKSMSTGIQQQPGATSKNLKTNQKWNKAEVTANGKFLGLAIVNISDLRKNPVQKVGLTLQSAVPATTSGARATEQQASGLIVRAPDLVSNSVGGELQVELLFLEHSTHQQQSSLQKSGSASSLTHLQQGDVVSIDRKLTPSGYVITTTTITKPTAQASAKPALLATGSRASQPSPISSLGGGFDSNSATGELDNLNQYGADGVSSRFTADGISPPVTPTTDLDGRTDEGQSQGRGRSRSRSRSLLRAIKKRFSFSRTRSRSVGESLNTAAGASGTGAASDYEAARRRDVGANLDTMSIDSRSRASSEVSAGRAKSVPASRDPNEVPTIVINKGRLSDTASAFTFTHPKSQLVIECTEPRLNEDGTTSTGKRGRLRYYAIPDDAANKRRWRKRGTKLHLFNDHQFVACHLAGSSTCHLCGRVFSRRPGKQGYKCRNCHLLSHKECHVKVDHNCPYASREGLKLEYIDADPPASLVQEQEAASKRSSGTLPRQQPEQRHRLGNKSISMELDDR